MAVVAPGPEPAAAAERRRPNVLVILTDDQAWSVFNRKLMPAVFERIAGEGVLFRRAYVNTPLCCPSRAQILTGLYEHHTGVDQNLVPLERPTLPMALQDAGYRTMLAGKYLNSWTTCDPRPEFDVWACLGNGDEGHAAAYSLLSPRINVDGVWQQFFGWQTEVLTDLTLEFIHETPDDQPFFALYATTSPHIPADDTRYEGMPAKLPRGPGFNANTLTEGNPRYARRPPLLPEEIAQGADRYARMARSTRGMDDSIATLLNGLGDRARDTLVVFVSDNGFLYGEHRRFGKQDAWEESVRVPLAIRYPAARPASRSIVSDAIVQTVDVTATIADVAGIRWGADGRSLLPILTGRRRSVRSAALIQRCTAESRGTAECSGLSFDGDQTRVPGYRGIVTERFKYVEYDDGSRQLIDLRRDPHELRNLAGRTSLRRVRGSLERRLRGMLRSRPETTIVTGPRGGSTTRAPAFTFFSPSRAASYRCRLTHDGDAGAWHACGPDAEVLGPLADGRYVFEVAGTDDRGRLDRTPARRAFTIRSSGPAIEITTHPGAHQVEGAAAFAFEKPAGVAEAICRLVPAGSGGPWTSCDEGLAAYDGLAEGNWVFEVRGLDPATDTWTQPPAAWPFRVDATPPSFWFTERPAPATRRHDARFVFATNEATAGGWTCELDGRPAVACSSGRFAAGGVGAGRHSLTVSAADLAGNAGSTLYEWEVDGSRPGASLGNLPPPLTSADLWRFDPVSRSDAEAFFLCSLDGGPAMPCAPSAPLLPLRDGVHTFKVWAVDLAGNRSEPDTYRWRVDSRPPAIRLEGGPVEGIVSGSSSASFAVGAEEPVDLFCSLDDAEFTPCTSPVTYSGLASGAHTFRVYAVDKVGNASATLERSWTVDAA